MMSATYKQDRSQNQSVQEAQLVDVSTYRLDIVPLGKDK